MTDKPRRKVIAGPFGVRGRLVTCKVVRGKARVQWRQSGKDKTRWYPLTPAGRKEAKAFAQGVAAELNAAPAVELPALTLRQLWDKYKTANFHSLRPKTQKGYESKWLFFEAFADRNTPAKAITRERLDKFASGMFEQGYVPNQIRGHIWIVTNVFEFGVDRDLIEPTKVTSYEFKAPGDAKKHDYEEYTPEEQRKIEVQFDPRSRSSWRAYVGTQILRYCGPRQNAMFFLEWRDVKLFCEMREVDGKIVPAFGGAVHWRPELDKKRKDRIQPLPAPVAEAFYIAWAWRNAQKYDGSFILYGAQKRTRGKKPYTYSAYIAQLRKAEIRAGVTYVPYRGAHGFRKGAAGNVLELTGDFTLSMHWIGDNDSPEMRRKYLLPRDTRMAAVASALGSPSVPAT